MIRLCRTQSVVMLMFREEKSPEDEIKAWQFWHGRQHSVKQRILDAGKITREDRTAALPTRASSLRAMHDDNNSQCSSID